MNRELWKVAGGKEHLIIWLGLGPGLAPGLGLDLLSLGLLAVRRVGLAVALADVRRGRTMHAVRIYRGAAGGDTARHTIAYYPYVRGTYDLDVRVKQTAEVQELRTTVGKGRRLGGAARRLAPCAGRRHLREESARSTRDGAGSRR